MSQLGINKNDIVFFVTRIFIEDYNNGDKKYRLILMPGNSSIGRDSK
jgi:hypothetical protein